MKRNGIFCITDGKRKLRFKGKLKCHILKYTIPKIISKGWKASIMTGYIKDEMDQILKKTALRNRYKVKEDDLNLIIHNIKK